MDPDEYDLSEQRFSASLDQAAPVCDDGGAPEAWDLVGAAAVSPSRAQTVLETQEASRAVDDGAIWRSEVVSRVENYRARRRRPLRERSLPLDFERAINREITQGSLAGSRGEEELAAEIRARSYESFEAAPDPDPTPGGHTAPDPALSAADLDLLPGDAEPAPLDSAAAARDSDNIIEFPRQPLLPVMPPCFEELAEPIIDRPRILEAPEEVDAASPLSDISVAPEQEQPPLEFELPLQVASMSRRIFAGLLDAFIVAVAAAVFVVIADKLGVSMPRTRAGLLLIAAIPSIFWALYEYLFLVYGGTTPGMQLARLQIITFDGLVPRRRARRARAVAMVLSSLALGLGVIWALLDEDTLCWHDRITRTYVVARVS